MRTCIYIHSFVCFFFFKQKTAYEMRISDWSSDVCSSDLIPLCSPGARERRGHKEGCPGARGGEPGQKGNRKADFRFKMLLRIFSRMPRPVWTFPHASPKPAYPHSTVTCSMRGRARTWRRTAAASAPGARLTMAAWASGPMHQTRSEAPTSELQS